MKSITTFKRKGIISLLMISLLLVFFSCDKEEDGNSPVNPEGGEIYQYQLVEINYTNELPQESEFEATLGEVPVTVNKTNEHTLKFVVPTNMPLGYAELIIPELSNTTVKYTVLAPQLAQTADETMENFMTSGSSFFSTPNPANSQFETAKGNFELFQEYFEQHATSEEKRQIALFYQVNKPMIDDLMVFNPDNLSSRFTAEDILIITKFTTAVAISVGGAFSVLYTPEISLKILGAAISGLAACRAIDYHDQLAARSIKVVLFDLGGLVGQSSRGIQDGVVVLQSDIAENINFQIGSRPLQQSDADSDNASLASFFSSQSTYNENIVKLNNVIASVNTFTPSFLQFSTFNLASLVTNPQTVNQQVTSEMMQDISFGINHPNLELVNATVSDQGQLNLKVKIVGEPASTPITSTLNYTYSDEISSFSGSFPIKINGEEDVEKVQFEFNTTTYSASLYEKSGIICNSGLGNDFYRFRNTGDQWRLTFYLANFHNNPIGTTYQLDQDSDYCANGYGRIFLVLWDDDDVETRWDPQSVTLTKTSTNSFTFTGTLILYEGTATTSISGTGTIKP